MGTKPPSAVDQFPDDAIETKAYRSVEEVPTREPNDRNRLALHVWRWLTMEKKTTLDEQIDSSRARLLITPEEARERILKKLKEMNVSLPGS
jgi:hypothetical protein